MDVSVLLLIFAALAMAAALVTPPLVRKSTSHLKSAHHAWDMLQHHASVLLEDRHLDPKIGDLVEFVVGTVGDGKLTRAMLNSILFRCRRSASSDEMYSKLSGGQEKQFQHFLVSALLYDSLRTFVPGIILRRLLYWLASTAGDSRAQVGRPQVAPVASLADRLCHSH